MMITVITFIQKTNYVQPNTLPMKDHVSVLQNDSSHTQFKKKQKQLTTAVWKA